MGWRRYFGLGGDLRFNPRLYIRDCEAKARLPCYGLVTPNAREPHPFKGSKQFEGMAFVCGPELILIPTRRSIASFIQLGWRAHVDEVITVDARVDSVRNKGRALEIQHDGTNLLIEFGSTFADLGKSAAMIHGLLLGALDRHRASDE